MADEKKEEEISNQDREEIATFEEVPLEVKETPLEEVQLPPITPLEELQPQETDTERLDEEEKKTILDAIAKDSDNEYITYNVHIVRNMETLESICETYHTNIDLIKEYNNIETINIGDKIIIPEEKDE